jgi:uncharacterized RDD family membrane protein YckC
MNGPSPSINAETIEPHTENTLYLGKWATRFWAWLIDVILIVLFLNIVRGILQPFWTINLLWDYKHWDFFAFGFQHLLFFLYWTISEGYCGQSVGKMVMNLKVVKRDGKKIGYALAALESVGKAFLPVLIFDCLIGWLGMPGTKLRLFNRISNTIVIKTDYREPHGIVYVKERE